MRIPALESITMDLFNKGWKTQTKEQDDEIKAVRDMTHHLIFHERWWRWFPSVRALSTFPKLESVNMEEHGIQRGGYNHQSIAPAYVDQFVNWWKQLRGHDAKVPKILFKSETAMDDEFKVRMQN